MIRVPALALLLAIASVALAAQVLPAQKAPSKSELFLGYSYFFRDYRHTQLNPATEGLNGWNVAYAAPGLFSRHVGLSADFSGQYSAGGFFTPQFYFITVGPRYSTPVGRSTMFVRGLVGALFASSDVIAQTSSQTVAVFAAGGGLDHPVGRRLVWRFNVDWFHGGFKTNDTNQVSQIVNNNVRLSTGPVLHF